MPKKKSTTNLLNDGVPSDGRFLNMVGLKYGRLTMLGYAGYLQYKRYRSFYWKCKCDCGTISVHHGGAIRANQITSCGCFKSEKATKMATTHGKHRTTEWNSWASMKRRCMDPKNNRYYLYGGIGIKVCARWLGENGFKRFLDDMGQKPTKTHSIDRYPDPYGNYEPTNCRWATPVEQRHNRRAK